MPDPPRVDLRVGLVIGPTTGGIGRHVRALAGELVARGHAVTVVGPASTADLFGWTRLGAVFAPAPIGGTTPVQMARAVRAVRAAADAVFAPAPIGEMAPMQMARAVRAVRAAADAVDVVHAHGARAGAVAALARSHPLVVTWHNSRPARLRRRLGHPLLERLAARGADVTLAVSPDLLERAAQAGADDVRLVAVPAPPLGPPKRDREQVRAELGIGDRPFVLALARLERQKRLDQLVDATGGWTERPDSPVVAVAGTGSLAQALSRQAQAVGSPLLLLGRRDDVADLLQAADLVVLPSDWEGYPLVAQEALRTGAPLVATAVGGVPALVGPAAALVPAGDAHQLRAALEQLLADPERRAALAAAGLGQARTWPTLESTVNDLEQIYRTLTSR